MNNDTTALIAGIDAGGTTFKCGLAGPDGTLVAETRIATTAPAPTLLACADFFISELASRGAVLGALGIAAFGPLDVDPASDTYGTILKTPKPGWSGTDLRRSFSAALKVPVALDTDVNAALAAEMKWGAAQGTSSAAYVTVGTGIGAGMFAAGQFIGKPRHPEFGHIRVKRHDKDTDFPGTCPLHGDCLEGLASAPAFTRRFGPPQDLAASHPGWDILAYYLAQASLNLSLSLRPERIILGGGLMLAPHLLAMIRDQYETLMNGYFGESASDIETLITRPSLGDQAGLMGGIYLAQQVLSSEERPPE